MSTRNRITFDERGFCNACRWKEKKENLEFISASFKSVKDGEDLLTYPEKQWMLTPFPKFKGHIYNSDNLATVNRRNFINEPKFIQAEKMALQLRHLSIGHLAAR
jgi:hypothetical protein|tara:strand:+ start:1101 stop:1415 length:315 start_codon:yes stop_codon:yes gene_type:complete